MQQTACVRVFVCVFLSVGIRATCGVSFPLAVVSCALIISFHFAPIELQLVLPQWGSAWPRLVMGSAIDAITVQLAVLLLKEKHIQVAIQAVVNAIFAKTDWEMQAKKKYLIKLL